MIRRGGDNDEEIRRKAVLKTVEAPGRGEQVRNRSTRRSRMESHPSPRLTVKANDRADAAVFCALNCLFLYF